MHHLAPASPAFMIVPAKAAAVAVAEASAIVCIRWFTELSSR